MQHKASPSSPLNQFRWPHFLRLAAASLPVAALTLTVGLAWIYVRALVHPACPRHPQPLSGVVTPTEVQLQTGDRLNLRAWYYPSLNGAALLALGGPSGGLGASLPLVEPLIHQGYGVLQIDTRACAEPPAPITLGYREAGDAAAGLAYLLSRSEVDPKRIGAIGFSMGGVAVIRAAKQFPEIAAVVAEGGYYNLGADFVDADHPPPLLRRGFLYLVAGAFWVQTGVNPWRSSPIDDLPAISPRPVFLIYGEREATDGRVAAQFGAALEPKSLWIVPGGDHGTNARAAPEEYPRRILVFFDRALVGQ